MESYIHTQTCTPTAILFIITKQWKQPKCPSKGEELNKLWFIHKRKYYSAMKTIDACSSLDGS